MLPVTARMHALLARELIAACGGLDESSRACRLKKSRLSECQTPDSGAYLTIDVIAELEAYCGAPHYTRAIADARPAKAEPPGELVAEACEASEDAAELQAQVRKMVLNRSGGCLTGSQCRDIDARVLKLFGELDAILQAAGKRTLRQVAS